MIRNFVFDFNHKGIAKHEVYVFDDLSDDFDFLPNQIIKNYKEDREPEVELVGVTEICGKDFINPQELEKIATSPDISGLTLISWYQDIPAGLKTLWQEPEEKRKMFCGGCK